MCDILYCSVNLPFYAHVYLGYEWKFGEKWCVGSAVLAFLFAYADWMALSLIALSRALSLYGPSFFYDYWTINKSKGAIIFVWTMAVVIMIPSFLEVSLFRGYFLKIYVIYNAKSNPSFNYHIILYIVLSDGFNFLRFLILGVSCIWL